MVAFPRKELQPPDPSQDPKSAELCISGALRTTAPEALNTILDG